MTSFAPIALLFAGTLSLVVGMVGVGASIASTGGLGGGGLIGPSHTRSEGYPNLGAPVSPGASFPGGPPSAPSGFPSSATFSSSRSSYGSSGYGEFSGPSGVGYGGYYGDGESSYGGHYSSQGYGSGYDFGYGSDAYGGSAFKVTRIWKALLVTNANARLPLRPSSAVTGSVAIKDDAREIYGSHDTASCPSGDGTSAVALRRLAG
ncbi:hypothetical protein HPB51_025069 [Rhipicephalus microplus]|uniref:Uncharacterized protein n=1 Tax=Rhipicephalus microplus TaxID=6941 RepID=A0A9J6DK59_RHIMP|nr:hypothetical protein HPB51_025069 [Rhipicephalus microplus]